MTSSFILHQTKPIAITIVIHLFGLSLCSCDILIVYFVSMWNLISKKKGKEKLQILFWIMLNSYWMQKNAKNK